MTPTPEQITAAARALADHNADVCNVNRDDNWNIYGDSFTETARVALEAAMGVEPDVDAGARDEREAFEAWATGRYSTRYIGTYMERTADAYERTKLAEAAWDAWHARAAGAPVAGSPAYALRGLYKPAMEYFIDGKSCTPDEYIAWQAGIIRAVTKAKLPDPKYYGGSAEEGDQHEVKCAYVDGWNDCRASILTTPPPAKLSTETVDKGVDSLAEAVRLTLATLQRQVDLIAERAPGPYLDKIPVWRSLRQHQMRLEKALAEFDGVAASNKQEAEDAV
jgi:hypothetical protein